MKKRNIVQIGVVLMAASTLAGMSFTACRTALTCSISTAFSTVIEKDHLIGDFPPYTSP
jgi:hypothetical protein